ncbi:hypothetical protein GCM10010306_060600 [Streptomyces umbrinus]|nr:hypothetical protein GCM10010306_060600 [Streptomyces umbrinus]
MPGSRPGLGETPEEATSGSGAVAVPKADGVLLTPNCTEEADLDALRGALTRDAVGDVGPEGRRTLSLAALRRPVRDASMPGLPMWKRAVQSPA